MITRYFLSLMIPIIFLSQALYSQSEHPGCCHESGNIFIMLDAPLEAYLRSYYSQDYKEANRLLKTIYSLDLIIQESDYFYLKKVKAQNPEHRLFIKGKKRSLKTIVMNAIVDNTIIEPELIHKEKDLDEHLFQNKKQIKLSAKQQESFCRCLLAMAAVTDGAFSKK